MLVSFQERIDLGKIARSGQCFRCAETEPDSYRFLTGCHAVLCRQQGPQSVEVDCTPAEWKAVWERYFDAGRSYQAVLDAIDPADGFLQSAARCGEGIRILRQDPWEMLVTFIVSQRKSIPAIRRAVEALAALCGAPLEGPGGPLFAVAAAMCRTRRAVWLPAVCAWSSSPCWTMRLCRRR